MMVVQLFFVIKKGETLFLQFNLDTFELYFCKLQYPMDFALSSKL